MQTINSLARALTLPLVLLVIITSCTPDKGSLPQPQPQIDVCPNIPGIQTNSADCPATPSAPTLDAHFKSQFTTGRPWLGGSDTCVYFSSGQVSMNGSNEVTSPIYFPNITAPVSFTLSAVVKVGNLTSPATLRPMYTAPFSADTTDRCADLNLKGYGLWQNTETMSSVNGGPWVPSVISTIRLIYKPDGSLLSETGGLSHYQVSQIGPDTYINWGNIGSPPNLHKQESLNSTTMVLSKYSTDGTTLFRITYKKVI
jgi:hypothetical protein